MWHDKLLYVLDDLFIYFEEQFYGQVQEECYLFLLFLDSMESIQQGWSRGLILYWLVRCFTWN